MIDEGRTYRRGDDEMVEYAPHMAVSRRAGERLGIVARSGAAARPGVPTAPANIETAPKRADDALVSVSPAPTPGQVRTIRVLVSLGGEAPDIAAELGLSVDVVREVMGR